MGGGGGGGGEKIKHVLCSSCMNHESVVFNRCYLCITDIGRCLILQQTYLVPLLVMSRKFGLPYMSDLKTH